MTPIQIADKFAAWQQECDERFNTLKAIVKKLNDDVKLNYEEVLA